MIKSRGVIQRKTGARRLLSLAAVAVVGALTLTGCASQQDTSANNTQPKNGGTLTYLEYQAFTGLYPPSSGFYPNGGVVNNLTDRLLYQDPKTLELSPWIATDLPEVNADATQFTFKLRTDATYSDGTKIDAANVVKNFDLFGKGDSSRKFAVSEQINNYDHGEVVDPSTVTFYFKAPSPGFPQATSTLNAGLLSSSTLDKSADDFGPGHAKEIIASGPFVVSDEQVGTQLTLKARDDYNWAPKVLNHQGRAYVDQVNFVIQNEPSVRIGALTSGGGDIARQVDAPDEQQVKNAGLQLFAAATNGVNNGFSFRFQDSRLSDIRVRQAVIAGVNREEIIKQLFTDNYPLATGPLAKTAAGYKDESQHYVYNPDEAKRLLDAAGWTPGSDGIRTKDGQKLQFTVNLALPQPRSADVITLVQQQLRQIGIDLQQNQGDQAQQTADAKDQNKVQIYHSMVGRADFDVLKSQYSGQNRNTLLNYDTTAKTYGDQHLEDLLGKIASEPTEAGRTAASAAAQDYLSDQAYILPLFEEPQVYGLQNYVQGFETEAVGRPAFYNTWLNK